ncbi:MAG: zinc-binding dehydrogenase [Halieaceae bacterium]|nr:zinc-binding dehydrogenase [Halieaceae bacterium]
MKAVVYQGQRQVELKNIAAPELTPDSVLIDVEACGICGSDLHMYREDWKPEICTIPYPEGRVPGHEFAGYLAAVADENCGHQVGDRVVGLAMGGMAERVSVSQWALFPIPDNVSFDEAATAEPMSNSLRIARKSQAQAGENVVVFGMGIIGLGVIQAYQALDIELNQLIAVDTSDYRLEVAKLLGADHVINPKECNVHQAVQGLVGTRESILDGDTPAVDIVCDCVGYIKGFPGKPVLQQALDMICDRTGRIMCFGMFEGNVELNLDSLINRQPSIIGVMGMEMDDVRDALAFMSEGRIDRKSLVTHSYPIGECGDAFEAQTNYADSVKVVLHPQE